MFIWFDVLIWYSPCFLDLKIATLYVLQVPLVSHLAYGTPQLLLKFCCDFLSFPIKNTSWVLKRSKLTIPNVQKTVMPLEQCRWKLVCKYTVIILGSYHKNDSFNFCVFIIFSINIKPWNFNYQWYQLLNINNIDTVK